MSQENSQSYANHARLHPPFHFVLLPASMLLLILTIVNVVKHPDPLESWILLLIGVMSPPTLLFVRLYPLKVQDRLIRLEERLRCSQLVAEPSRSRLGELTEAQYIALRFASDAELPGLVEKTLSTRMGNKDIKQAIVAWRADRFRV